MARDLAAAYEHCRRIHTADSRTFYLATLLLPRDRRPDVWAHYAFARVADQLVDPPASPHPAWLLAWRDHAGAALLSASRPDPSHPVLTATGRTMRTFGLKPALAEFLDSIGKDLTVSRYQTWHDLRGYMRGSAAVIGELMAPLLGEADPRQWGVLRPSARPSR